ncbi:DUF2970 domain-containing protein [Caballeronia choica]|uniref:DUF2970 domain-containing protein n=1 Tax=Caballeronia choica TaxID=326476 RepID=UPI00135BFBC0|nr:DUF2970 domain-containing protein [Caballeronia choica]
MIIFIVALLRTVFWRFLGVRSSADHRADLDDIKVPLVLPLMAFVVAGMFAVLVYSLADIAVHVAG